MTIKIPKWLVTSLSMSCLISVGYLTWYIGIPIGVLGCVWLWKIYFDATENEL